MNTSYQKFLNECMLELVKKILTRIQHENLYWDQIIYISYRTDNPLVVIPAKVKQEYPKEISIVLQHQFEDLNIQEEGFSLKVSFEGIKEEICIPFQALISFVDVNNNYKLTFSQQLNVLPTNSQNEKLQIKKQLLKEIDKDKATVVGTSTPNIIVLDKFRNSSKSKSNKLN